MDLLFLVSLLVVSIAAWWLVPFTITWLLLVTFWVLACYMWTRGYKPDPSCDLPLPPGNLGIPFCGETLQFIYSMIKQGDFYGYRRQKYGNVFKTHVMGNPTIRVSGTEDVSTILTNKNNDFILEYPTSVRTLLGEISGATMTNGDVHKLYRRLYLKTFTSQALKRHLVRISEVIQENIKEWLAAGDVTVYQRAHRLAFSVSFHCLLGLPQHVELRHKMEEGFNHFLQGLFSPPFNIPGTTFSKAIRAKLEMQNDIKSYYKGSWSMIDRNSAMWNMNEAAQQQEIVLSEQSLLDLAIELSFAGHVTNASSITSLTMVLGKYPDVLNKVREELTSHGVVTSEGIPVLDYETLVGLPYLDSVVKEVLFLYPPAGAGFRRAVKTVRLQIPRGWYVIYDIRGTHGVSSAPPTFNPDRWKKEDKSKRERFNFLTFSAGSRPCAGKEFALLVLKCFTVHIACLCDWKLENPEVKMVPMPALHPEDNLPIKITDRKENLPIKITDT